MTDGSMASMRTAVLAMVAMSTAGCGLSSMVGLGGPPPLSEAAVATIALGEYGTQVAVRADGAKAYVPVRTNKVLVVDTKANKVQNTIPLTDQPYAIGLSSDGARGYVMDFLARDIFVLDTQRDRALARLRIDTSVSPALSPSIAVSRDGSHVYGSDSANDEVHVVDTATNTIVKDQFLPLHPGPLAVSPDGGRVYVAGCKLECIDGELLTLDAGTMQVTGSVPLPSAPSDMALAVDGSRAWVAHGSTASVSAVDLASGTVTSIGVDAEPVGLAADPRRPYVYVAGFGSSTVGVIDTRGNVMVGKLGVGGPARAVGVSPDGTHAYVLVGARCVVIDLEQALASMGGS